MKKSYALNKTTAEQIKFEMVGPEKSIFIRTLNKTARDNNERWCIMGDKGKKDKNKGQKQKKEKQGQEAKKKLNKQPKRTA